MARRALIEAVKSGREPAEGRGPEWSRARWGGRTDHVRAALAALDPGRLLAEAVSDALEAAARFGEAPSVWALLLAHPAAEPSQLCLERVLDGGDSTAAQMILAHPRAAVPPGGPALLHAVRYGNVSCVRVLLGDPRFRLDEPAPDGAGRPPRTPLTAALHAAVKRGGKPEIVRLLLADGRADLRGLAAPPGAGRVARLLRAAATPGPRAWLRGAGEVAAVWDYFDDSVGNLGELNSSDDEHSECPSESEEDSGPGEGAARDDGAGEDDSDDDDKPGNRLATRLLRVPLADGRLRHGDLVRFYCDDRRSGYCVVDGSTAAGPVLRQLFCNRSGALPCFTGCREHADEVPAEITRWIEDPVGFYAPCFRGDPAALQRFYSTSEKPEPGESADAWVSAAAGPDYAAEGPEPPDGALRRPGALIDRADGLLEAVCLDPRAHRALVARAVGGRPVSLYVLDHAAWLPQSGTLALLLPDGVADRQAEVFEALPPGVQEAVADLAGRVWTSYGDTLLRLDDSTPPEVLTFEFDDDL